MTDQKLFRELDAEETRLRRERLWFCGPRTALAAAGLLHREVPMAAVLAFLLRPDGQNRAGRRFLDAFTELVGAPPLTDPVWVVVEESRATSASSDGEVNQTRADLVLRGAASSIVVEAKVHAGEQADQLLRLHRTWSRETNPTFVFLTTDGRTGTTADEPWTTVRWADVAARLRVAATAAGVADRFADTIDSLERVGND